MFQRGQQLISVVLNKFVLHCSVYVLWFSPPRMVDRYCTPFCLLAVGDISSNCNFVIVPLPNSSDPATKDCAKTTLADQMCQVPLFRGGL